MKKDTNTKERLNGFLETLLNAGYADVLCAYTEAMEKQGQLKLVGTLLQGVGIGTLAAVALKYYRTRKKAEKPSDKTKEDTEE
ncbi:MAG: hypothetical protein NC078_05050 [Ruminococcus sp.]|nr:hypothetical protein [Ruminococcus sp.]